jgi:hypothetical protein
VGGAAGSGGSGDGGSTGVGGSSGSSGSGGTGTGGDSGTGGGGGTGPDSGTVGDTSSSADGGGLLCGTLTCNTSDPAQAVCCIDYPAGAGPGGVGEAPTYTCVATASACQDTSGGMAVSATCAGSANCTDPANPVCCQVTDSNGNNSNQCQSNCGSAYQFCQTDSECPAGNSCTPLFGSGPTACSGG